MRHQKAYLINSISRQLPSKLPANRSEWVDCSVAGLKINRNSHTEGFTVKQVGDILNSKNFTSITLPTSEGLRFEIGRAGTRSYTTLRFDYMQDQPSGSITIARTNSSGKEVQGRFSISLDSKSNETPGSSTVAEKIYQRLKPQEARILEFAPLQQSPVDPKLHAAPDVRRADAA